MKEFIEVHIHAPGKEFDRRPVMVNLDWVEDIHKGKEDHAEIYLAFNSPRAYEQDHLKTVESYDDIKLKIWRKL